MEFDKGRPLEISGNRELRLFPERAVGPVFPTAQATRINNIFANTIFADTLQTTMFYKGWGFFENADQCPATQVIATYQYNSPTIISGSYGKGKYLLSGVHFAYDFWRYPIHRSMQSSPILLRNQACKKISNINAYTLHQEVLQQIKQSDTISQSKTINLSETINHDDISKNRDIIRQARVSNLMRFIGLETDSLSKLYKLI